MLVSCQECGKTLKVPDSAAGKRAKCPSCQSLISIPLMEVDVVEPEPEARPRKQPPRRASTSSTPKDDRPARAPRRSETARRRPAPSEYDDYEQEEDPWPDQDAWEDVNPYAAPTRSRPARPGNRGRQDVQGLETVGMGLLIQGWSIAIIILTIAGVILFALLASAAGPGNRGAGGLVTVMGGLGGLVLILASLGVLVGEFFCLATPERTGARGLIITTVICLSIQILINIGVQVAGPDMGPGGVAFLGLISGASGLVHFVTYLLFQRKIASYIRREDLARTAQMILMGMGTCAVLILMVAFLSALIGNAVVGLVSALVILPCGIGAIVFAVMQLFLLFRLGSALRA